MDQRILIAIIVLVAFVAVLAIWTVTKKRRSGELRARYGPEYDRAVRRHGNAREAEAALDERQKRVAELEILPLSDAARQRYSQQWWSVQSQFVEDPGRAIMQADMLVSNVMSARGYPVGDFEQRSADISVDHPFVVEHYRTAHEIAFRHEQGTASTEELRKAMIHYRLLFEDLLGIPGQREVA